MRIDRHERVRSALPLLARDDLGPVRRRIVRRHLRRCADCAAVRDDEAAVVAGLGALAAAERVATPTEPPDDLLDDLLAQARDPGLRGRVAAPARGAVSGARPGLSVALGLLVLGLAGLAIWTGWRLAGAAERD